MRIVILFCTLTFCSCRFMCGLDDKKSAMLEEAQEKFNNYCRIEDIPCENFYLNIKLMNEEDAELTSQLHKILYDNNERIGWQSLHIYDKGGKFSITHHANGKRSTVAPNW